MATREALPAHEKSPAASAGDIVLELKNLKTWFGEGPKTVRAVDDVSFRMRRGETLCIVGESGSGKSVTARSILQLIDRPGRIEGGQILFQGERNAAPVDIAALAPRSQAMRDIRGRDIAMIFQEPMTSLSPIHTIGWQIMEAMLIHEPIDRSEARRRTASSCAGSRSRTRMRWSTATPSSSRAACASAP